MIDSKRLLADLQKLLKVLEADIRERLESQPERVAEMDAEWRAASDARRTAATQFEWREERITQAGVHWILGTVFLRFLEDNGYLERPFLFGPDAHAQALATDRHTRYFRDHPDLSDRDYLLHCFADAAQLPGLEGLFDPAHNPLYRLELTGDGSMALRDFWRRVDPDTGAVVHDFSDSAHGTRFLGDLYQDLSELARKRYALLQTPEFIEEFILDRTLLPAIEAYGYRVVRLIDPTCGSGHFLLGAFRRLLVIWQKEEPARNPPDLAQRALDAVWGVDLNPFAIEIARFRLLVAALNACRIGRLRDAPNFRINLAIGDSLLHGPRFGMRGTDGMFEGREDYQHTGLAHAYAFEDLVQIKKVLGQQYHAVVGNPPYITSRDKALNDAYRARYASCHRQFSLGVPFTERFFELALEGNSSGYVGLITANSFMKREFGKPLIEEFLPRVDLTHVIDTSGAYIPGHGTPTVILLGRNRQPVQRTVRTVMRVKGEPSIPQDPAQGQVWRSIVSSVDMPGSETEFVSVADIDRGSFAKHPWSIGGGGAVAVKERLEEQCARRLSEVIGEIGFVCMTRADDLYFISRGALHRAGVADAFIVENVEGDRVRDWSIREPNTALFPYDSQLEPVAPVSAPEVHRFLWPFRAILWLRREPNGNHRELGLTWWEWSRFQRERFRQPLSVVFASVATHNHFVLDRGGRVFKQSAPVIKLSPSASDDEHFALLGVLNSSVACFWMKQVFYPKSGSGIGRGIQSEKWMDRYDHDATKLAEFPLVESPPIRLAQRIDALAQELVSSSPASIVAAGVPTRAALDAARRRADQVRGMLIALQEELDWSCYRLYGLLDESLESLDPPEIAVGERAFEIVLARRLASGTEQTTWFERHRSSPVTDLPSHWSASYRALVVRRVALIESQSSVRLIERPEYKRRWNDEPWESQEQRALRDWLLDRLETEWFWPRTADAPLRSASRLADLARSDSEFMQVAALYVGHDAFDVETLVCELVDSEAVPYLPVLRYTNEGLRKRAAWERTWDLQRHEDATGTNLDASVPPKYTSSDFCSGNYWRLRGPLDVPKERFVSYPGATLDADGTMVVTWAGYDHLLQAKALAGHFLDLKDNHGWGRERLIPLLAGLAELLPWLKQWHNEPDPTMGERMGDYFEGFVQDEARAMGVTGDELRGWRPQSPVRGRRRRS